MFIGVNLRHPRTKNLFAVRLRCEALCSSVLHLLCCPSELLYLYEGHNLTLADAGALQAFPLPGQFVAQNLWPEGIGAALVGPGFINCAFQIRAEEDTGTADLVCQGVLAVYFAQITFAKLGLRQTQERREAVNLRAADKYFALLAATRTTIGLAGKAQAVFVEFVGHKSVCHSEGNRLCENAVFRRFFARKLSFYVSRFSFSHSLLAVECI